MVDSVGVGEEMATMRLGSKSEVFHREGQTWNCTTGLPSDVVVEVGDVSFNLHKFPLLSRSGTLEKIISALPTGGSSTSPSGDATISTIQLHDLPGGALAFELIAKFCYGTKFELTAANVVAVRCASEHLQMTEDYGERNMILHAENFLQQLLGNWKDTLQVLNKCEAIVPESEDLQIVSRCINSLAIKASSDTTSFRWPTANSSTKSPTATVDMWNGIGSSSRARQENADLEWWHEDVTMLSLSLYKRFITAVGSRGVKPEFIAGSVVFYAKRHLPGLTKSNMSSNSDPDQKLLLEEIIQMLPAKKGITSTKLLLLLLRTSMILRANAECQYSLESRIGVQLEEAVVEDLLMPNLNYSADTLYDVECVQRVLDHFMGHLDQSGIVEEKDNLMDATPILMVGKLVDGYLAEVASDANLKFPKFQALAATIPDYARPIDDGLYRAIDIYLKAHPWLTDSEREQLCRSMNCQKLSLEACTHAAQNERLPLRMVVQVLFFEQLRLRTSIASWFFVSDNLEASQNPGNAASSSLALVKHNNPSNQEGKEMSVEEMRARVAELERECSSMKVEIEKVGKGKASGSGWSQLPRRLGIRLKAQPFCAGDEVSTNCQKESGGNRRKLELLDV